MMNSISPHPSAGWKGSFYSVIRFAVVVFSILTAAALPARAQGDSPEISGAIRAAEAGQADSVRKVLPDLIARYQNTPGLLYLQGRLASDGLEAVKFYQSVVDNFPKSEWADDALYRIYQYYYALGLYRTAEQKMQILTRDYPHSVYVTGKPEPVMPKQEERPVRLPAKEQPPSDSPKVQPAPKSAEGGYTLQVGAFSSAANAQKQKSFFEDAGYQVVMNNKTRSGHSVYLVWVGSYKTTDEARTVAKAIKSKFKIDAIIVEKD
jgi:cell division septation protein DedD